MWVSQTLRTESHLHFSIFYHANIRRLLHSLLKCLQLEEIHFVFIRIRLNAASVNIKKHQNKIKRQQHYNKRKNQNQAQNNLMNSCWIFFRKSNQFCIHTFIYRAYCSVICVCHIV